MANTIRIRRRLTGSPGAPASLANAELAYNEVDHTLYYGEGTGGAGGTATAVVAIGGSGIASNVIPLINGTAAAGTHTQLSRDDHIHPTDTTRAALASPVFSGTPNLPTGTIGVTQAPGNSSTALATTAFVATSFAPLASPTFTGTVTIPAGAVISGYAPLASPVFTGAPSLPTGTIGVTQTAGNSTTALATTAFVTTADALKANLASPTFTGTVTIPTLSVTTAMSGAGVTAALAPYALLAGPTTFSGVTSGVTPTNGTNTTQFATTAYVLATRLDQLTVPAADVSMNSHKLINLLDPTNPQDAATKSYADNLIQGLAVTYPCKVGTTANITLSGTQTIDGVAVVAGDRVLVKDQTTAATNGIYVVAAGAWARSTDADIWNELVSAFTFVEMGTLNADNGYTCTVDPGGTLGTTPITWVQFSGAGQIIAGNGLQKSGNTLSVGPTAGRIAVTATAVDIDAAYVGQTSITTLGSIASGTWNGTTIAVARGGTGAVTLTGYVKGNGVGVMTAAATIPNTDITGLGTMSTQNATAVAITGGTFDNIVVDGGTF